MEQVDEENENIEAVSDVTEEITRNDIDEQLVIIQSERKCYPVFSLSMVLYYTDDTLRIRLNYKNQIKITSNRHYYPT